MWKVVVAPVTTIVHATLYTDSRVLISFSFCGLGSPGELAKVSELRHATGESEKGRTDSNPR